MDLDQTNLGANFAGHDITAVVEAVKKSPAMKEKSEFETTPEFEARRASFREQPLFGEVTPAGLFAFAIENSLFTTEFKYDADAQAMSVKLTGRTMRFIMDKDRPTLDTVLVRRVTRNQDSYVGNNAFGASVRVDRTYAEEFGATFEPGSWLFSLSERYKRIFTYLLAMDPIRAKQIKADLKLLFICRLTEPWLRHSAHGHDPTVGEPYESIVGDQYLQVSPVQLWVINTRTGEVIKKFSPSSAADGQNEQMTLKLRQTPLILEVRTGASAQVYHVQIDEQPEKIGVLDSRATVFEAKQKIVLTLDYPRDLSGVTLLLNGKEYTPSWSAKKVGSSAFVLSATITITPP